MSPKIAIVIPTYKAKLHIIGVIKDIPDIATKIYVIDDACPDKTGDYVLKKSKDKRVKVLVHDVNQGVGGATLTGFKAALIEDGFDIAVKIDADGQISPSYVSNIAAPIQAGEADYVKGSRFLELENLGDMPRYRIFLNSVLSFTNKFASGYYSITDPTNGLVAITRQTFERLNSDKIAKRYFFESDMLFRLGLIRARVKDISMRAVYADETSSLRVKDEFLNFAIGNIKNFLKRIWLRHFIANFHLPAIYLIFGLGLTGFGTIDGLVEWISNLKNHEAATPGQTVLPAICVILGFNMLMHFFLLDVGDEP